MTGQENKSQQYYAAHPQSSVWVSAHAGSGKTHVLIDRVMRLLLAGVSPPRILCITFTKAAAAEMAERLHKRLGQWTLLTEKELTEEIRQLEGEPPSKEKLRLARLLFARTLEMPDVLRIQTIHAFCQSVLQRFPIEAGISPAFRVMDEHAAHDMMARAKEITLDRASQKTGDISDLSDLSTITHDMNDAVFAEIFAEIIKKKRELDAALPEHRQKIKTLAKQWGLAPNDDYENLRQKIITGRDDASLLKTAKALQNSSKKTDQERGHKIAAHINDHHGMAFLENYIKIFFTQDGQKRKILITKHSKEKNPGMENILVREQERMALLIEKANAARALKLAGAIAAMADSFLKIFARLKDEKGFLDYDDLITKTQKLFRSRSEALWVLYRLDGGLDHILIDEAQDTNPEQWQLIQSLTEEFFSGQGREKNNRTLFAVGDPKQSIFSFQGVSAGDFARMQKFFSQKALDAQKDWKDISLTQSFRSAPEILALVDQVFSGAPIKLGGGGDEEGLTHIPARASARGMTEIWPVFEDSGDEDEPFPDGAERLAHTMAAKISDLARAPIKPADILVLVRRRNMFVDHLIRALKRQSLPVAGFDRLQLDQHLAVMDMISLAKFVLLPDDDLSLAEILKSPLGNLSEYDLMELALGDHGAGREGSLWAELCRKKDKYRQAYDFLSFALRRADFTPVFEFFSEILEAQNMRARLAAALGPDVHDPLDEFLNIALSYEQTHTPSLQGFVHWLARTHVEVKRDMERGRDEIRIMTIHGAKGLEAKIVFLVDVPPRSPSQRWMPVEMNNASVMAPFWRMKDMPLRSVEDIRDQRRAAADYEENRLLYVALTRAADQLYVCGYQKKGESALSWLPLIAAKEKFTPPPPIKAEKIMAAPPDVKKSQPDRLLAWTNISANIPASISAKIEEKRISPSDFSHAEHQEAEKNLSLLAPAPQKSAARAGSIMHEALRHASKMNEKKLSALLQRRFPQSPAEDCQQTAHQAYALAGHPDLALYFERGLTEVPVSALFADETSRLIISGQIDRLILDEKNRMAQIIDYKTDKNPPDQAAAMPPHYQKQLAAYRAIFQKIRPDWHIRAGLIWTRIPRLDWADENRLDYYAKMIISDKINEDNQ